MAHQNILSRELFELFQRYKSKQLILVEPGGNFGDYLIWKGAQKLARLSGIRFHTMKHRVFMAATIPSDTIIYIHGGGGYVPFWSGAPIEALKKATLSRGGVVIQGPQTFTTDSHFLKKNVFDIVAHARSKKIYLFAREKVSYQVLKNGIDSNVELHIDHDTALNLISDDLNIPRTGREGDLVFYAIREDAEEIPMGQPNHLSMWFDPVKYCRDFDHWLYVHCRVRKIITNRTHSAIIGTILGIPTTLLPNCYHKNRAVWEYSLCSRGVKWMDAVSMSRITHFINTFPPLRYILSKKKIQDVIKAHNKVRYEDFLAAVNSVNESRF